MASDILKNSIKRLAGAAGYEVRRRPSPPSSAGADVARTGWIVEITGPSGAGKSTLRRKCLQALQDRWVSPEWGPGVLLADTTLHATLFDHALARCVESPVDAAVDRSRRISYHGSILNRDQWCLGQSPTCCLLDEGIFHCFPSEIAGFAHDPPESLDLSDVLGPRAFVLLSADLEVLIRRIRAREAEGQYRMAHRGRSDEEIKDLLARKDELRRSALAVAREHGCPVLEIHAGLDMQTQLGELLEFLASLENDTGGAAERAAMAAKIMAPVAPVPAS